MTEIILLSMFAVAFMFETTMVLYFQKKVAKYERRIKCLKEN